jgi:amino acid adenylation domain-containing protein
MESLRMLQNSSILKFPDASINVLNDYCEKRNIPPFYPILAAFNALLFHYSGNEQFHLTLSPINSGDSQQKQLDVVISDNTLFDDIITSIQSQMGEVEINADWKVVSDQGYAIDLSLSAGKWNAALSRTDENHLLIQPDQTADHLVALLTNVLTDPSQPVITYSMLTKEEWQQIVIQWNRTESPFPNSDKCIHQWIEEQAKRIPDAIAITDGDRKISYRDLWSFSNQLAARLHSEGLVPGENVGIFFDPSIELVGAMLAVLQNDCAFVAFDNLQPKSRIDLILEEVKARFLVASVLNESTATFETMKTIRVADFSSEMTVNKEFQTFQLTQTIRPEDVCFILFTSGSTGKPKGVLHTHRNIVSRFNSLAKNIPMGELDVFSQSSPLSSIDAIDELLFPLFWGASTAIIPAHIVKDPRRLVQTLERVRATHILLVPSLLRIILEITDDLGIRLGKLHNWIIGGEPLDSELAKDFHTKLPAAKLINYYGLTEGDGTLFNTSLPHPFSKDLPIGRAAPNVRVYLLNSALQPVPIGLIGEICIGGSGIARGYLNLPELNKQRFIDDIFEPASGTRLFRTGDLGRWLPDGNLEYLGRKDFQVKIRGFRVELSEVEDELRKHPAVKEAVVVPWELPNQPNGSTRLVAYIVKKSGNSVSTDEIRDFLGTRLPEFAVPAFIFALDAFPLNANGKIDRKALPEPQIDNMERAVPIVPPGNETEVKLVQIWEEILGVRPIGIQDSVFDLGGDSLSIICILVQVESVFGKDLPIDIIFRADTVAKLAEIIRGETEQGTWSSLVPIQSYGSKPPLFCVHADGGVLIYRSIAKFLGSDYPVYGLQAQGLDGKTEPLGSVEEIARHYITEIRTVKSNGPYLLCGFSLGGVFIYEMARQLAEAGDVVSLVGFLDAGSPDYPQFPRKAAQLRHKITVHLISLGLKDVREKFSYLGRRTRDRLQVIFFPIIGALFQKLHLAMPHNVRYVVVRKTLSDAVDRYKLSGYTGDITVFRARIQPEGCIPDPTMGWGKYVSGKINIIDIEGNHNTMMKDKYLHIVVDALREFII